MKTGMSLVFGIMLGVVIGAFMDNIGVGIAVGTAFGMAMSGVFIALGDEKNTGKSKIGDPRR